ncbi:transposase [Streptomyces sp. NPDC005549]|uniref:transposase n=1 Tax=Streptomyces sp. NPDC005549 TaxID=3154888 RepID=UPI0033BBFE6D
MPSPAARRQRGIAPTIAEKTDQRRHPLRRGGHGGRPSGSDRETYRRRNTIERCFHPLKGFRGMATRYEKTATSGEAAVSLASLLLSARSVCGRTPGEQATGAGESWLLPPDPGPTKGRAQSRSHV